MQLYNIFRSVTFIICGGHSSVTHRQTFNNSSTRRRIRAERNNTQVFAEKTKKQGKNTIKMKTKTMKNKAKLWPDVSPLPIPSLGSEAWWCHQYKKGFWRENALPFFTVTPCCLYICLFYILRAYHSWRPHILKTNEDENVGITQIKIHEWTNNITTFNGSWQKKRVKLFLVTLFHATSSKDRRSLWASVSPPL